MDKAQAMRIFNHIKISMSKYNPTVALSVGFLVEKS